MTQADSNEQGKANTLASTEEQFGKRERRIEPPPDSQQTRYELALYAWREKNNEIEVALPKITREFEVLQSLDSALQEGPADPEPPTDLPDTISEIQEDLEETKKSFLLNCGLVDAAWGKIEAITDALRKSGEAEDAMRSLKHQFDVAKETAEYAKNVRVRIRELRVRQFALEEKRKAKALELVGQPTPGALRDALSKIEADIRELKKSFLSAPRQWFRNRSRKVHPEGIDERIKILEREKGLLEEGQAVARREESYNFVPGPHAQHSLPYAFSVLREALEVNLKQTIIRTCEERPSAEEAVGDIVTPEIMQSLADDIAEQIIFPTLEQLQKQGEIDTFPPEVPAIIRTIIIKHCFEGDFDGAKQLRDALPGRIARAVESVIYQLKTSLADIKDLAIASNDLVATAAGKIFAEQLERAGRGYAAEDVRRGTSLASQKSTTALQELAPLQWHIIRNNTLIKQKISEEVLVAIDDLAVSQWAKEPYSLVGFPSTATLPTALLRLDAHPELDPARMVFVRYVQALADTDQIDRVLPNLFSVSRLLQLIAENPYTFSEVEIDNPELERFNELLLHDPEIRALILEKSPLNTAPAITLTSDAQPVWQEDRLLMPLSEAQELLGAGAALSLGQDIDRANPLFKEIEELVNEKYIFSKIVGFRGDVSDGANEATWFQGVDSGGGGQMVFHIRESVYARMLSTYGFSATPAEKVANPVHKEFRSVSTDLALELFDRATTDEEKQLALSEIQYGVAREKFAAVAKEELSKTHNMALAEQLASILIWGAERDTDFETVRLLAEVMRAPHDVQLEQILQAKISEVLYAYRQYEKRMNQLQEDDLATLFSISPEEGRRIKEIVVLDLTAIQPATMPRILELVKDAPTFEFLKALSTSNGGMIQAVRFLTSADLEYLKMMAPYREAILGGVAAVNTAAVQEKITLLLSLNYFLRDDWARIPEVASFLRTLPPNMPHDFIVHHIKTLLPLSPEERQVCFSIFQKIELSPSQEIQKLKDTILSQIFSARTTQGAVKAFEIIEGVFVKNNLPTIGKIFKVFSQLYPARALSGKITEKSSPVLQSAGPRRRTALLYRDLLRAHLESGNRSLRDYLGTLQEGEGLFDVVDEKGVAALTSDQKKRIERFLRHVNQLFLTSALGASGESTVDTKNLSIGEQYAQLRQSLGAQDGEKTSDRLATMFLQPMGFTRIEEALAYMQNAKSTADARGRSLERMSNGALTLRANDLLKGVETKYIEQILQNGSVAREFLGADAGSDATPLDTDVAQVGDAATRFNFSEAISKSAAYSYGELLFGVRADDRFIRTTAENAAEAMKSSKMELFKTGVVGEDHYGVRTGFGTTQIDFMIAKKALAGSAAKLEKLFYEVAKNGFYVPIVDEEGTIIFTSKMYDEYRKTFAGIQYFEGPAFKYHAVDEKDSTYREIRGLKDQLTSDQEKSGNIQAQISEAIKTALAESKVTMKDALDGGLLGADLYDTGSTARHTNLPGGYDFDFALRLDAEDFARASVLAAEVKKRFTFASQDDHIESGGYYQLRIAGVSAIDGVVLPTPVDIDIGFARKSDLGTFASHDSLREKYQWIKEKIGTDAYEMVLANILFAKKVLKAANAYKKQEEGGFGGIGTENWIMAHGGNAKDAFRAFREAAYDGQVRVPLEKFKERYKILDAGYNIKFDRYDNYALRLRDEAYNNLLDAIEKYL